MNAIIPRHTPFANDRVTDLTNKPVQLFDHTDLSEALADADVAIVSDLVASNLMSDELVGHRVVPLCAADLHEHCIVLDLIHFDSPRLRRFECRA